MKQATALILSLVFLLLCGCGASDPEAAQTAVSETAVSEPQTVVQVEYKGTPANGTLGKVTEIDGVLFEDASVLYRTEDSYRFEQDAADAAKAMYEKTLSAPETLELRRVTVWDCADDGDNVYYSVHLDGSYLVESGERISSGYFCDVGVRKADGSTFDAGAQIADVVDAYSVFRTDSAEKADASDESDPVAAAKEIALSRLKVPAKGTFLSAEMIEEYTDFVQVEVLCRGVNDFEMELPCIYTVYLTRSEDKMFEWTAE